MNWISRLPAFFRRKILYIILIVVFSLVLLLDLTLVFLVPGGTTAAPGSTGFPNDAMQSSGFPDTDSSDSSMPGADFSGEAPSFDFSDGEMPDTDGSGFSYQDGEIPSDIGGSDGSRPDYSDSGFDSITPGGDSGMSMGGQMPGRGSGGFLQNLRQAWLAILIPCAILDAASIAMLILVSRSKSRTEEASETPEEAPKPAKPPKPIESPFSKVEVRDVPPNRRKRRWLRPGWIIVVVILILLIVVVRVISLMGSSSSASDTSATVHSDTAETGSLNITLPGAGTLTDQDAAEVSVPTEVDVTSWAVSNGDAVEEGDTLATVDRSSVLSAIAAVQSTMDALDQELAEAADAEADSTITAAADARVIQIYAAESTSVADTMYENGALLLLSLDGMMEVEVPAADTLSVGDSVTVTLSDDSTVAGKVESITDATARITLTDNGPSLEESVTVTDESGTVLGTGTLSVHSPLTVTGTLGTVSSIAVTEGQSVSAGDTLLTLTDTADTARYETLLLQRADLEEQLQQLFALYETGTLCAPCSGVVSGLDSSFSSQAAADSAGADSSESAETTSDAADSVTAESADHTEITASSTASAGSGYTLQLLSYKVRTAAEEPTESVESAEPTITEPVEAETPDSSAESEAGEAALPGDSSTRGYAAIVLARVGDTLYLDYDPNPVSIAADAQGLDGVDFSIDAMLQRVTLTVSSLEGLQVWSGGQWAEGSLSDLSTGDYVVLVAPAGTEAEDALQILAQNLSASSDSSQTAAAPESDTQEQTMPQTSDSQDTDTAQWDSSLSDLLNGYSGSMGSEASGSSSGNVSGWDGLSDSGNASGWDSLQESDSEESTQATSYTVAEQALLSVTPQDTMDVTITVDEMDILQLEVGQSAQVTLDAMTGRSFSGTVTSIDRTGTSSDGDTKYTAVVTIPREASMLAGMNASVQVILSTAEDVLLVSADAVYEEGSSAYVYTSYNEKSDTLGDPVEVTTGRSDGQVVEITSGLDDGDTVYYSLLDTVNYSVQSVLSSGSLSSLFGGGGGMGGSRP